MPSRRSPTTRWWPPLPESWVSYFLDWHLRTDHPWDTALHLEALQGYIREDLEALIERIWHDMFPGPPDPDAFVGLRGILGKRIDTSIVP